MKYCKKCLMPTSRPKITFKNGICNACLYSEIKWKTDWKEKRKEFLGLIKKYKSSDGSWDCIVPWSGGKDSSTIAYRLKFEFGMNPLLVTIAPQLPTEVGNKNREALINQGFDHIYFVPNGKIHRKLAQRFFREKGNQKAPWEAGVNAVVMQVAIKYKIPLVFFAEHGESEYGGQILSEKHRMIRDIDEVIKNQLRDDPRNWIGDGITLADMGPYIYPDLEEVRKAGVKAYYFGYFFKWSSYENYLYIKDKYKFNLCETGRTDCTFTNFDSLDDKSDNLYYYMQFIKFGFGRALRDASRMIQNRQMTREKALELVRKYDDEFCHTWYGDMLEYLDLTCEEFVKIVDSYRKPDIWKKEKGEWKLRFPPK